MRKVSEYLGTALVIGLGLYFGFGGTGSKLMNLFQSKPYLELTGSSPYDLHISEFDWGYGRVEFNKFSGDFKKLDEKVFDLLEGKNGTVSVYLLNSQKDQYGKIQDTSVYIGDIDLLELNKYEDWEYWHNSAGIKSLLYKKFVEKKESGTDSTAVEYVPLTTSSNPEPAAQQPQIPEKEVKTFSLEQTDLYPDPADRANQDYQTYTQPISGTIKYADFYHGVLEVNGDDGELYALRLLPDNLPTSLKSDVRYFMKAGNRIWCVCTVAGARELVIVQVKFTEG
ncbi:hypothetical protein [Desertivirga xinjiangensis]|uniref:hypothetical protein n=1 Tax=Desertivirga xinjiangensis TaxID=539206 RepID=UPI00210CB50B|nr:hypothetical protein [Pedobacter xinjiangensis]